MPIKPTVDNLPQLEAAVKELTMQQIMVGVPKQTTERETENGEDEDISNADLAYIHENGAPEAGIPARKFLVPGIERVKSKLAKGLMNAADAAIDGESAQELNKRFNAIGMVAETAIKDKMVEGPFEALKPATLADRLRRGITGTAPLIATAALKASIKFVLRKRNASD
jgi:hypothetical protein